LLDFFNYQKSARARARRARRWFVPQFPAYQGSVTDGRRRRRAENRQFRPILGLPGVAKRRGNVGPVPQKSLGFDPDWRNALRATRDDRFVGHEV
jgi:hypothetical protein